jgi:hypothetical protein
MIQLVESVLKNIFGVSHLQKKYMLIITNGGYSITIKCLTVIYYTVPLVISMSTKKSQNTDKAEQQALKEIEIVAELAPNERTRKEAEKLIETIEEKSTPNLLEAEREAVENVLDETKKAIGKTTNQAKREIPQFTKTLGELQTDSMQATKQIGYDCIEFQKELTSLLPEMQQRYISWFTPWWSTRIMTEYYTKSVDNFVDNTVAATNLANTLAVVNMETIQQISDTNKEYCRLGLKSVRNIKDSLTQ